MLSWRKYSIRSFYNRSVTSSKFDPEKHHRRSIRLPKFDYSQPGAYFITIVAYQRALLFGKIVNKEMQLNDLGKIADECWRAIPDHFTNVELSAYIVMPNHVHGIIVINHRADADPSARRGTIYRAPTEQFGKPVIGSIPTIIRTYKAAVTRRIGNELRVTGVWQRNYYEHVIRNDHDLQNKTDYIEANPLLWDQDDENPFREPTYL